MSGHYDNYLILTIIVLVILPILLALSNFFGTIYAQEISDYFLIYLDNENFGTHLLSIFQYFVFVVMLIIYPIYPNAFSIDKYFGTRDPQCIVIEYEFRNKLVYVLFPFFILGLTFIIVPRITVETPLTSIINFLGDATLQTLFLTIISVIVFIVGSALLKVILLNAKKEFRFYFAKTLFRLLLTRDDDMERMKYLIKALNSYNKYIRRNMGLEISNLKKLYSKIVTDPDIDVNYSIMELSKTFEDHNNKLKTIRYLSNILKITDNEQFLVKESIGKKLEDWAASLGTIVSTIAAIIGVILTIFPKLFSN